MQERSRQATNLSGQCHKADVFFFGRRFYTGLKSPIYQLAQQFSLNPMLRNAPVKFRETNPQHFQDFEISVTKRQIGGALVWPPQPALLCRSAWGARQCPGQSVWRLRLAVPGRPRQCCGKCKEKRRNGYQTHQDRGEFKVERQRNQGSVGVLTFCLLSSLGFRVLAGPRCRKHRRTPDLQLAVTTCIFRGSLKPWRAILQMCRRWEGGAVVPY